MFEKELEQEEKTLAAERGRSPSDAASVFGPALPAGGQDTEPTCPPPLSATADHPQVAFPTAETDPPRDPASASEERLSDLRREAELAGDIFLLPDDEPFPEEPFEELRRPRLIGTGKSKGRRLVKPEESPQPAMTPEQRLLILDTWQRSGLPAGDFAALVGRLQAHALRLEEEVRRSWARPG